jgi:hypothetical protein
MTLTTDPLTLNSIGVIYLPRPTHPPTQLQSLWANAQWFVKLLIKTRFYLRRHVTLIFDPFELKINRGYLLVMANVLSKSEVPIPKRSLVIDHKPFGQQTDRPTNLPTDK